MKLLSFHRRRNESADVRHLREQAFWKRRGSGRYSQFWWTPALNVTLMGIVMAPCGNSLLSNKYNGIRFSFSCGSNDTSNGAKQWFAENRHAIASTQNSQPPHARRWRAAASHLAEEHRGGGSSFDLRSKMHQNTIRWWNCCDSYEFNLIMFGCLFRCWFQRCNFTSLSRRGPLFDATEEELRSMMGYKPVVKGHHEDGPVIEYRKGRGNDVKVNGHNRTTV